MAVKPIPDGYHSVTPYLVVDGGDAAKAIDFYKHAFGAQELFRMPQPDGRIGHAEIKIGDSPIMLADECPQMKFMGPKAIGGTPVGLMIYVKDCDAVFDRAIKAGATMREPVRDQFYGDRSGQITDPFGHTWTIATHVEDVPPDELERRAQEFMKEMAAT
jgi:PhnB protein